MFASTTMHLRVYVTGFKRVWFGEFSQPTEEHVILQFYLKHENPPQLGDVIFSPNRDGIIKTVLGMTTERPTDFVVLREVAIN